MKTPGTTGETGLRAAKYRPSRASRPVDGAGDDAAVCPAGGARHVRRRGGLIGAALWLWMAQSCKAGKGWARTVSTVFFGIETLSVLASLGVLGGGLTRIYGLVVWVIGLIAIILLWQRPSSDYFRGAPRY